MTKKQKAFDVPKSALFFYDGSVGSDYPFKNCTAIKELWQTEIWCLCKDRELNDHEKDTPVPTWVRQQDIVTAYLNQRT